MAGARIIFPEFRDEQSDSRYPFADTATLKTTEGVEIDRSAFIDAAIYAIGATVPLYISSITVEASSVTITIGDKTTRALCSAAYNPLTPPESGVLSLYDAQGRSAGILLSDREKLSLFGGWAETIHAFAATSTEFVGSVVQPAQEPGVRGLTLTNSAELISGDIWLVGGHGVVFRQTAPNVISVDIIGVPLFKRALCAINSQFTPPPILRTINGCGPDEFGNFHITVTTKDGLKTDSVLRVYPENNALKITTVGSKVI